MAKVIIKQTKSGIDRPAIQKRTLKALGLSGPNTSVEKEATPAIMGMVRSVSHLVTVVEKG